MEQIMKMLEKINYENVIFTTLQILLILIVTWMVLAVLKLALRRLEQRLLHRGQTEGEVPSESAKRVETLTRLLRQGVIIVVWVIAGLVVLASLVSISVPYWPALALSAWPWASVPRIWCGM